MNKIETRKRRSVQWLVLSEAVLGFGVALG
jgi:hypothetical protein